MGIFGWLKRKNRIQSSPALTDGARDFLAGRKAVLTAADIDPEGAAKYAGYEEAMVLKKAGRLSEAAEILEKSCNPPSIYKGHYRELFRIWRQFNRIDIKAGHHDRVVYRVLTMIRYDDEMIREMLRYWSIQQKRELPPDYFDRDRNLLVSDAKALRKAAEELEQSDNLGTAAKLIASLNRTKG